jgi:ribosomal protein S18 acetylase RimI-like enzyme
MLDLRTHHAPLIHRIWQHDAEYFGTMSQRTALDGYMLYVNPGLAGRYDPNHVGLLRIRSDETAAHIERIIAHFDGLRFDSVVYLDRMHRPDTLPDALRAAGFRPMLAWGQYDLMAVCDAAIPAPGPCVLTHPSSLPEFRTWASLDGVDAFSDADTMMALRITECSSPAVIPTIIWSDDAPAGRCLAYIHDGIGRIESVYVDPIFRRRGLARAMVAAVAADIVATGAIPYLFAEHAGDAQRIYRAIGFETLLENAVTTWVRPFTDLPT